MRKAIPFSLLLILLATACSAALTSAAGAFPEVGAQAPDFTLETLHGETVSISDFRGQVVLVNFWATWCGPCRLEMPAIQEQFESTDLVVLAVNFDESPAQVQAFVDELGLTFTTLLDPGGKIQLLYQVRGYPTSYFVDEEGTIQILHIGFMNEDQLDGYMRDMGLLN